MDIILEPKRLTKFFSFFVACFTVLHVLGQCIVFFLGREGIFEPFVRLLNLDVDRSIPSFFSSMMLLTCSFFLFIIASAKRKDSKSYIYWAGLSLIFLLLSIDEALMIHESLNDKTQTLLNTSGYFYFAWIIPYGLGLIIFLLAYMKFLLSLPCKTRILFIIAGFVFVSGAIGLEAISGKYFELYSDYSMAYIILSTIEEILEMSGIVVFIYALTSYMDSEFKCNRFRIKSISDESHNCTGNH
jgi:hypothetical protein